MKPVKVKSYERKSSIIDSRIDDVGSTGHIFSPDRNQHIYYKITSVVPSNVGSKPYYKGPCFYIENSSFKDGYSVYRDRISFNPHNNYKYELSSGWEVLGNLTFDEARDFCQNNLKYLK